ncbi:hypothetical protein LY78DRAFT_295477 [Colletotrichum sublineola]|nr:hypothetical protein LY78DRAFT_295477 [Colletotrichum sublineola]
MMKHQAFSRFPLLRNLRKISQAINGWLPCRRVRGRSRLWWLSPMSITLNMCAQPSRPLANIWQHHPHQQPCQTVQWLPLQPAILPWQCPPVPVDGNESDWLVAVFEPLNHPHALHLAVDDRLPPSSSRAFPYYHLQVIRPGPLRESVQTDRPS